MNSPEWGAMFFDQAVEAGAKMFWGARGAIRYSRYSMTRDLELYPDRQSFVADDTLYKPAFVDFINYDLIPFLDRNVEHYSTKHIELHSEDGSFHAVAEDRSSGGYLYIGAWSTAPYENEKDFFTPCEEGIFS